MIDRDYIDPQAYIEYYTNQAGTGLPGFYGTPTMYGAGLFKGLFRIAVTFIKRGFFIAKPHLKTAAKGFVNEVVSNVMTKM